MNPTGYTWQCLEILFDWGGRVLKQTRQTASAWTHSAAEASSHTASPEAEREALCGQMLLKDTPRAPRCQFLFVLVGTFTLHLENITALVVTEMEDKRKKSLWTQQLGCTELVFNMDL